MTMPRRQLVDVSVTRYYHWENHKKPQKDRKAPKRTGIIVVIVDDRPRGS